MRRSITQSYLDVSMIFKKVREVIFRPAEKSVRQLHAVVLFTHGLHQTEHRLYTRCGRLRFNVQASWLNFCVLTRSSSGWCVGRFRVTSLCERESSPHLALSIYTFKSLPVHLKDHRALSRSEVTEQESVDGRRRIRRLCVCVCPHTHRVNTHPKDKDWCH